MPINYTPPPTGMVPVFVPATRLRQVGVQYAVVCRLGNSSMRKILSTHKFKKDAIKAANSFVFTTVNKLASKGRKFTTYGTVATGKGISVVKDARNGKGGYWDSVAWLTIVPVLP